MPSSGKLRATKHISGRTQSIADDWHYPREGSLLGQLRSILKFCWAFLFWFAGNAIWNLIGLFRDQTKPHHLTNVLNALFLPHPLDNPGTPLWVFAIFVLLLLLIIIGYIWAKKDLQFEEKVLQARKIRDEIDDGLESRGIDRQFPRPQGPPVDIMRIPHPGRIVGRSADLQWLLKRLQMGRTNSITGLYGLGGIGKTALTAEALRQLHAKRRFRDGIAVIRCQGVTNEVEVLRNVLARFDAHRRLPEARDLGKLTDLIHRLLDRKNALIVLDNVEPTLAITEVVAALHSARGITLLLTSRQILPQAAVPVEAGHELLPLAAQEALDLFTQSLGRSTATLAATEHDAVTRIIELLGCHTLAVKMVGAYAASRRRDLVTLADELNNSRMVMEMVGDDETPGAVALAFAKSIHALPAETQQLFAALAAFPTAEFSRRGALTLAKKLNPSTAESDVDLLVPRALVEASTNKRMPQQSDRERWRLHPLMRMFATATYEKWTEQERYRVQHAVATYYATYTNTVSDEALGSDEANITGALEWAYTNQEDELIMKLCAGTQYFWLGRWRTDASQRYLPWGIEAAKKVASRTNKQEDHLQAATLALTYGQVLQQVGQVQEAKKAFEENLTIFQQMKDQRGEGEILASLGEIAQQCGQLKEAEDYYEKSLLIFRDMKDRQGEGEVLTSLGEIALQRGRLREAESYYQQSLDILYEVQSRHSSVHDLVHLGEIALQRGQKKKAEKYYEEALVILSETQNRQGVGWVLGHIGMLAQASGQLGEAAYYYQEALMAAREVQYRKGECWVLGRLGTLAQVSGQIKKAEEYYQEALAIAHEVQDRKEEGRVYAYLGKIAQMSGQVDKAEEHYQEALAIANEVQDALGYADVSLALGTTLIGQQGREADGCSKLKTSVQLYASMKLPNESEARRIAQQLGCGR